MALDPAGGQRVRNLVRYMVSEFVEDNIVPASLAEEGGRVPTDVPARDDQLVVERGREAAPAPSFAATAHEKLIMLSHIMSTAAAYVEAAIMEAGNEGHRSRNRRRRRKRGSALAVPDWNVGGRKVLSWGAESLVLAAGAPQETTAQVAVGM